MIYSSKVTIQEMELDTHVALEISKSQKNSSDQNYIVIYLFVTKKILPSSCQSSSWKHFYHIKTQIRGLSNTTTLIFTTHKKKTK